MKYGEFSSLVQLGVGLHLGTALLQLFGEWSARPVERTLNSIQRLLAEADDDKRLSHTDNYNKTISDFNIFKIQIAYEYNKYVKINSFFAVLLIAILIWISFRFDDPIGDTASVLFAAASVLPAPLTLFCLWVDANRVLKPIKENATAIQKALVNQSKRRPQGSHIDTSSSPP